MVNDARRIGRSIHPIPWRVALPCQNGGLAKPSMTVEE
jgi:hypothetical protein